MEDLTNVAVDLVAMLNFYVEAARRSTEPSDVVGAADSITAYYQAVGICELLLDAEVDAFFNHMIRSGRTRRWLLRRAAGPPAFSHRMLKPSNTRGLFGAVLADDLDLAKEIAKLSSQQWNPKVEYEDDFLYAHFLHRLLSGESRGALDAILVDLDRATDGAAPPRVQICRALHAVDHAAAAAAFDGLVAERRATMRDMKESSVLATDDLFVPLSSIYVEGLAILRLFERAGIPLAGEYPFCPGLARGKPAPFVPAGFPD